MAEIERRRDGGELESALELAIQAQDHFTERADITWLHVAELQCRLGRGEAALATIEEAVERRALWRIWPLTAPLPYFDAIEKDPRYSAAVAAVQRRIREMAPRARLETRSPRPGHRRSASPPPLLIALHGANGNSEELEGWFASAPGLGWLLALAQSSQPVSEDGRFCWDDPQIVERDLAEMAAELRSKGGFDPRRVVIAGFSQGAVAAVRASLTRRPFESLGFLVVCPAFRRAPEIESGAGAGLVGRMLVGRDDTWLEGAAATRDALEREGCVATLEVVEGVGHGFPGDFPARLPGLLAGFGYSAPARSRPGEITQKRPPKTARSRPPEARA